MFDRRRRRRGKVADGEGVIDPQSLVDAVPFWWHSIDLGEGVVTPGFNGLDFLRSEWDALSVPDLQGRSVLDVGAWDGYFSFEAERHGARAVTALDHYVWSLDIAGQQEHWRRCSEQGVIPPPYHQTEFWRPHELPGKEGFDTASRILGSEVRGVVDDFMECELKDLGVFDVVLYLGVLYHMEDPMRALRRVAKVTREVAIITTQAVSVPGFEDRSLLEFFPGGELNNDVSNWWAPSVIALEGLCRAAGFSDVRLLFEHHEETPSTSLIRSRVGLQALK
jgi:tRNA (mo5U34)-methyltransferase